MPAQIMLLVGVDAGYAPYGAAAFTPETTCETTETSNWDPFSSDFGTHSSTECVTAEGWDGAKADVGTVFPAITLGGAVVRDRVRLTALFKLGPILAAPVELPQGTLTPDLALGGNLSLEYLFVSDRFSFAGGALGDLRGFEAHGTNDGGDTRLGAAARFSGGPTLSVGWEEPRLYLRLYGLYGTEGELGGGLTFTWAPVVGAG